MSLLADLEEFVTDHRPHGPMTGDATEPAWNGYLLTVACPCGVTFERWLTPPDATVDLLRADLWGVELRAGMSIRRVFVDLDAIACWLVIWLISVAVSTRVASWVLLSPFPPSEEQRFYMFTVFFQSLLLVPVGLACSTLFLWVKRDVRLFIARAVPVGLANGLSPVLLVLNR